jgi:hypothetical protein
MERTHTKPLSDDRLRPELEAGDTVVFRGKNFTWEEIEQQVERLGFGDSYLVIATCLSGRSGDDSKIKLRPKLVSDREGGSPPGHRVIR